MINVVRIRNFRSIADADISLGPLTVLVGRNGAGKSSFVDAIHFVRDAVHIGLEHALMTRKGISAVRRWAPRKPYDFEIGVQIEDRSLWADYSFTIASGKQGTFRVKREICSVGSSSKSVDEGYEIKDGKLVSFTGEAGDLLERRVKRAVDNNTLALSGLSFFSRRLSQLKFCLNGRFYNIFPNVLREPQKPSDESPLKDHGENLSTILKTLHKSPRSRRSILAALTRVVDGVTDFRVREVGGFLVTELRHGEGELAPWFELSQESDGTLRLLGILAALYQQPSLSRRWMVAIEEPENSIHPGALAVLADEFDEAAARHQVLLTTQSPDLISRFSAEQLRVVERTGGITSIGTLHETQRAAIEQELFTAGDLLRIEGLRRQPPGGQVSGA